MAKLLPILFTFLLFSNFVFSQEATFRGEVVDASTGEWLTGATVTLSDGEEVFGTKAVGLDGSFAFPSLESGEYSLTISSTGYTTLSTRIRVYGDVVNRFTLTAEMESIAGVTVIGTSVGTDVDARRIERLSPNVMNVISAKQIQLSPDITVANVVQRVSGLSIERNSSGDPQYAIVRGMDKRYNNTLVNGIKIPSPDNENRFVPLDIFPAVFLERLEVYKSLTADMEADAIGGTVNMVMKSAPARRLFDGDFQIGYNQRNFEHDFGTYDRSRLSKLSPKELFGDEYRAVPADFPAQNMMTKMGRALPDIIANATYGDRFFQNKLGVMVGGSFQNSYRPMSNFFYDPAASNLPGNPLNMRELIVRSTYTQQQRMAVHGKLDYVANEKHNFSLYLGQYFLNDFRIRDQYRQERFATSENYAVYPVTRFSNTFQSVSTADLRGMHDFSSQIKADWSLVYSLAENDRPDDGVFSRTATYNSEDGIHNEMVYFQGSQNSRTWERNRDQDLSAYLNFTYKPNWINEETEIKFGGVARNKTRDNFFNYYGYTQVLGQYKGQNWNTFEEVNFPSMANPLGGGGRSNLVYDATENIYAGYVNGSAVLAGLRVQAGLRLEHTTQTYDLDPIAVSSTDISSHDSQSYLTFFPSLSIKKLLNDRTNLKASYFKGISRPGFYEIVPTIRSNGGGDSFYSERGNADLRPAIGHSLDLRYEYFPTALDQILVGVFYKKINDPIEYGFPQVEGTESPNVSRILPQNFADANNIGVEADFTKYFSRFGIRANYTYTNSSISTNKVSQNEDGSFNLVNQKRSLQGQSAHIGNLSLLWKDANRKLDVQVVLNYTGERIAVVSPYLDADHLMRPMTQLDFSLEKGFGRRFVVFAKVNNILNTPYELYVNKPLSVPTGDYPYQSDPYNKAFVRQDLYGQSYRLGVRYNLN